MLRLCTIGYAGNLFLQKRGKINGLYNQESSNNDGWSQWGYGEKNTQYSPTHSGPIDRGDLDWSRTVSIESSSSTGPYYIGHDLNLVSSDEFLFYYGSAYKIDDGSGVWSDEHNWITNPVVDNNNVIIVTDGGTDYGKIQSLDIEDGTTTWTYDFELEQNNHRNPTFTSPALDDDKIYVFSHIRESSGQGNIELFVVDSTDGSEINHTEIAGLHAPNSSMRPLVSPGLSSDELVLGVNDGRNSESLLVVSRSNGTVNWKSDENFYSAHDTWGVPSIEGNIVYFANGDEIFAYDLVTKSEKWSYSPNGGTTSPVLMNNLVIFSAGSAVIGLNNETGTVEWEFESNETLGEAVASDDAVYIGEDGGWTSDEEKIYAIDPQNGSLIWETQNEWGGIRYSSPIFQDGKLFLSGGNQETSERTIYSLSDVDNTPPEAAFEFEPSSPTTGDTIEFDASNSSDEHEINSYYWDFTEDGQVDSESVRTTHTYDSAGTYQIQLEVQDTFGLTDTVSQTVTVSQPAEVPDAQFSYTPSEPRRGESVRFDAAGSGSPDGVITEYEWTIDGQQQYGEEVTHTFEESGEHSISLKVTDGTGLSDSTQKFVTVEDEQLSVSMRGDRTDVSVGEEAFIELSLVNFLTSESITAQLVLQLPSGVSMSGVSGADEGSGQTTAVTNVDPGSETNILVRLQINESGELPVSGRLIYMTPDGSESDQQLQQVTISAEDSEGTESGDDSRSSDESEDDSSSSDLESQEGSDQPGGSDVSSSDSVPGFGVGEAIVGLTGGYLALDRLMGRTQTEGSCDET